MDTRTLLGVLMVGLVAGWLASLVMGGGGLVRYVVTGVIGSFVGAFVLARLRLDLPAGHPILAQIVTATIGAIIVIALARLIA